MPSTRSKARAAIQNILCDTDLFPVGCGLTLAEITPIVIPRLTHDVIDSVKGIDHSIREALQTLDGYSCSTNVTRARPHRKVIKEPLRLGADGLPKRVCKDGPMYRYRLMELT